MRTTAAIVSAAAVLAYSLSTSNARADTMDPAIERLTKPVERYTIPGTSVSTTNCAPSGRFVGNISPTQVLQCKPDNDAFAKLIGQYGMAIAPSAMHSARTTGFGGFHLAIEGTFTWLDNRDEKEASYLYKGTQGSRDPNGGFSDKNTGPAATLPVYSLKIRKGFPFGFEIGGQVGYVGSTSIITGGADVRLSLLEGFRKGALGILPDLSAGGGVRTISGTSQFNLTVASFDVQISKNLPLGDSNIIVPYVGFQQLWIFGDSGLIDTTPNTDPLGYCNYVGPNVPGNPDPDKTDVNKQQVYDGQPVCRKGQGRASGVVGSPLDFNNTFVFDKVRLVRQRLLFGLHYRYEVVFVGAQFATEMSSPDSGSGEDNSKLKGVPKQSTLVVELGAVF